MEEFTHQYISPEGRIFDFRVVFAAFDVAQFTQPLKQSYGVLYNDKQEIVLVASDDQNYILPGGTIDAGETPKETLIREAMEEAAVEIDPLSIKPLFYQEVFEVLEDGSRIPIGIQLRYIAKVTKVHAFTTDPGGNMKYQKWVKFEKVTKYLKWGRSSGLIQEYLLTNSSKL